MDICLFKVNNRNFRTNCEICSKLRHQTDDNDVVLVSLSLTLNVNFEQILDLVLVFLLLTLSR